MDNFNIDGKALINAILSGEAKKEGRDDISGLIKIFNKYHLTALDGMALLFELMIFFDKENDEE